ncbi:MAG: LD-carboxypeptidase [Muribaculaceae bacterium]|nr:LD-carboxypeptidase [Muribaculaceae bacterium]
MKGRIIGCSLIAFVLLASFKVLAITPQAPPFLKPGDKIAVISPSGTHSLNVVDSARSAFSKWGFETVVGKNIGKSFHGFAGTIAQRKADLLWALRDTTIKAIMCADGGYGACHLLCEIPLKEFNAHPKWLIGYSDITALHSAQVVAGNMSIHGNMCYYLRKTGGTDTLSLIMRDILLGKAPSYTVPGYSLNVPGTATGIVVGGNISVFTDLAGSQYDFLGADFVKGKDIILFFEDTNEDISHVDRMLHQLKLRGLLSHVKGIIVGKFKGYKAIKGYKSMEDMLSSYLKHCKVPVCYDFPTGHFPDSNYPMIEGCPAKLTVAKDSVKLEFMFKTPKMK